MDFYSYKLYFSQEEYERSSKKDRQKLVVKCRDELLEDIDKITLKIKKMIKDIFLYDEDLDYLIKLRKYLMLEYNNFSNIIYFNIEYFHHEFCEEEINLFG